jgi:CHASE3 domain sensor protein
MGNIWSWLKPAKFSAWLGQIRWWPVLQKIAAGFLIVVGVVSILQYMGYLGGQRLVISEQQLTETVQDMIVAQQTQERQLMLRALLTVKEDVELQQRTNVDQLEQYLISLEQRYVDNMEENNQYLRTLLSR